MFGDGDRVAPLLAEGVVRTRRVITRSAIPFQYTLHLNEVHVAGDGALNVDPLDELVYLCHSAFPPVGVSVFV